MIETSTIVLVVIVALAILIVIKAIAIVPQQHAWVVERLGKFDRVLSPGAAFVIPFIERVAYKHSLKEIPLDVPSQVCITRDNTQLQVDGVLYFQVTDPMRASYGASNYPGDHAAGADHAALGHRQDGTGPHLRRARRHQQHHRVLAGRGRAELGREGAALRDQDLTPPNEILRSMQAQITAEREKRALIAASEGRRQEQINIATGEREAAIARSEGEKQAQINQAQGEAAAVLAIAEATAKAVTQVAEAVRQPGGMEAVNLKVAERYVEAFGNVAKQGNTLILPANLADVGGMIASAMTIVKGTKTG